MTGGEVPESEGLLLVDKPAGPTSHDAVSLVKRSLQLKKAGHLGTLDPAATGLLVVAINDGVKLTPFLADHDKEYRGALVLGIETNTQDAQGEITAQKDPGKISREQIEAVFKEFVGPILQRPPAFSAVKLRGQRLYKLARAGKKITVPARPVIIKELEVEDIEMPKVIFRALVSKGTYIRALAADIGGKLGVGAHLDELRRLKSGPFRVEDAIPLGEIATGPGQRRALGAIIPPNKALGDWPQIIVQGGALKRVSSGNGLTGENFDSGEATPSGIGSKRAKVVTEEGLLVALIEKVEMSARRKNTEEDIIWRPLRVWRRI